MIVLKLLAKIPWRYCFIALLLGVGVYLAWGAVWGDHDRLNLRGWIARNGDAELKGVYAKLKTQKERVVWDASCRCYEARFGKGAWIEHFKKDIKNPRYADLVEAALSIEQESARDKYLTAHLPAYEACLKANMLNEAQEYAAVIKELSTKGGQDWKIVSTNPFAVCVYRVLKEKAALWTWYAENSVWADAFLMTLTPEDAKLEEIVVLLKDNEQVFRRFHEEIYALSEDDLKETADSGDVDEGRQDCFRSCLPFVANYKDVLLPLVREKVPLIEAMAVVANSIDAFDFDTPQACRHAGSELASIYKCHQTIWNLAAEDEYGCGVIRLYREVPIWGEQVLIAYGRMHVAAFIRSYCDMESKVPIAIVTETIARCEEAGWAILQQYKDHQQFRQMLIQHSFRLIPYLLKNGQEKVFTDLWEDPRFMDRYFDKDGKLKRVNVGVIEMLPFIGDAATAVKHWMKGEPCTMEEIGWAVFDVVDTVATVASLGMSKVATTTAKSSAKTLAKRTVRQGTKQIMARQVLKTPVKETAKKSAKITFQKSVKKSIKSGVKMMKKIGRKSLEKMSKARQALPKTPGRAWNGMKKVLPKETWEKCFRAGKALMWIGFVHQIESKGADFVQGLLSDFGETMGKLSHSLVSGVGDGVVNAVKGALGMSPDASFGFTRILKGVIAVVFVLLAVLLFMHSSRTNVVGVRQI